jgi:hypothetical protein
MTTIVEMPSDQSLDRVDPEHCARRGNLYVCEDCDRHQLLILAQKVKNIEDALEELGWQVPATSSLFDAATCKQRKGKTGAWAVHRLPTEEVKAFLAQRRRHFARTVIAASNPKAWRFAPVEAPRTLPTPDLPTREGVKPS